MKQIGLHAGRMRPLRKTCTTNHASLRTTENGWGLYSAATEIVGWRMGNSDGRRWCSVVGAGGRDHPRSIPVRRLPDMDGFQIEDSPPALTACAARIDSRLIYWSTERVRTIDWCSYRPDKAAPSAAADFIYQVGLDIMCGGQQTVYCAVQLSNIDAIQNTEIQLYIT